MKLQSLVKSRRFWLAAAGLVFVLATGLGLNVEEQTVQNITLIVGSWIVGDSLRKTE